MTRKTSSYGKSVGRSRTSFGERYNRNHITRTDREQASAICRDMQSNTQDAVTQTIEIHISLSYIL